MGNFNKLQLALIIGFIIVLISIPLSLLLIKDSQIFKSQASDAKKTKTSKQQVTSKPVTSPQPVPSTSPLSELQKILESSSPGSVPSPTETPAPNLAFGPTLTLKINLEGRPADKNAAKVFIGISAGIATSRPSYILSYTIDFPNTGAFNGISLAGLNPGSNYTAYIKGPAQIVEAITFAMSPTETILYGNEPIQLTSGDLNEDNVINSSDYTIAKNLYGIRSTAANWNPRADFNLDGVINNIDLSYVLKNMGKTGDSGTWISSPPPASSSGTPSAGDRGSPSGGYWMWVP